MLHDFSWTEYLILISLASLVYYLVVGVKYYSHELRSLMPGKGKVSNSLANEKTLLNTGSSNTGFQQTELFSSHNRYTPQVQQVDDTFEQVEKLTTKLTEIISFAASNNSSKEELIIALQNLAKNYRWLKGSPFIVAINNLITSECDKHGISHLSSKDRVMLWEHN